MRKLSKGSRFLAMLLVLAMTFSMAPLNAFAAKGDIVKVSTGLTGGIDTSDTISLPIRIMDYEADGMLFEFAEAAAGKTGIEATTKTAKEFGATWAADFASMEANAEISNSKFGTFTWSDNKADLTKTIVSGNQYANYLHATFNHKSASDGGSRYGRTTVITPNDLGGIAMNDVRYLVMVYRSNLTNGNIGFWVERENMKTRTNDDNRTGDLTFTSAGATNWTYAVYDMKQGELGRTWDTYGKATAIFTTFPMDASGEYIDIAHIALFKNKAEAEAFGEYALTDGSDRGDNRAFGLLRGSRNQTGTIDVTGIDDVIGTGVQMLNTYTDKPALNLSTISGLGYNLLGTFGTNGIANIGLLESSLSAEGYPVYKKEVVDYLASLLQKTLTVSERTSDGWKNYRYVKGTASSVYGNVDLATALRNKKLTNDGSYAAASTKNLIGTWAAVNGNIKTYHDAAYFLLNSIFVDNSYNQRKTDYNYLVLSAGTDSASGKKTYVFDGGFTNTATLTGAESEIAIDYNASAKTIQNTAAVTKAHFHFDTGSSTTTLHPFVPIQDRNNADGMTKSVYYQDDGVINGVRKQDTKDTLYKRNFSFAIATEGEFVYHADDELFFEFDGDDDVYLFINNELVMDNGSAHSINTVRFDLNDYVNEAKAGKLGSAPRNAALALEEGATYTFKFYYMERHSYGSNIRISTNIRVTDPAMQTEKLAWQGGQQLNYGAIVNADEVVEYGFAITNTGEDRLHNLSFIDNNIGVELSFERGLYVTGSNVTDVTGGTLEASDLTAVITHDDYSTIKVTFADNNALKAFLKDLTAAGTEAGGGLYQGATVQIRGIGYKLTDGQKKAGVFDNAVLTAATNKTGSKQLQGQDSMRVYTSSDLMYYQWAGHPLVISKDELYADLKAASAGLADKTIQKVQLVTKAGTPTTNPNVSVDGNNNMTVNYPSAGSNAIYLSVTYSGGAKPYIISVAINVTEVKDSVFVLDYGLSADLTEELLKEEFFKAPSSANSSFLKLGTNGNYANNEITIGDTDGKTSDGQFQLKDGKVLFTPSAFLEHVNSIQLAMNVYETATPSNITGTLDINKEVEMYKNITVVPANVIYYEDNFPAITYSGYEHPNKFEDLGSQSADQDENYGSDEAYDNAGDASLGSLATITIDNTDVKASFQFTGTGFELIGRTNASDSASLIVKVVDSNNQTVKYMPVITEFKNNGKDTAIVQVPVIRVNGLTHGQYTVQIQGVPANDYSDPANPTPIEKYLYIDGLRIYQPSTDAEGYYNDTEKNAEFIEIRKQIVAGNTAVVEFSETDGLRISTSTMTWTENLEGTGLDYSSVSSVNDYLLQGPNNEVYMYGEDTHAAIVFYVKPEENAQTKSLQVAVRAIDDGMFFAGVAKESVSTNVNYATYADGAFSWTPLTAEPITSSTEQYYTINLDNCYWDETKGAYQVVLWVDDGMASFSSLKMVGLDMYAMGAEAATLKLLNGTLYKFNEEATDENARWVEADPAKYVNFAALSQQFGSDLILEPQESAKDVVQKPVIGSIGDKLIGIGGNIAAQEIELVIEGGAIEKRENLIKDLIGLLSGSAN